jgi:RNA-directed DNA polymerase
MKETIDLKSRFLALSDWKDLEALTEYYYKKIKINKKNVLDLKTISFLLFNQKEEKYTTYTFYKKNGSLRTISAPQKKLKLLQQVINECIQDCYSPRSAIHGFVKERSIVTNAKNHVNRRFVYNIDLKNFFPTISFRRVVGVFKSFPFRFDTTIARHLANLCCNKGVLPQGAPTSPILSNLVCRSLDRNLWKLAQTYKVRYSRYADDITFSSNQNIFTDQFLTELEKIVEKESFLINRDKVRLQSFSERQIVTGIVVNKKLSVKKGFKKDLRFLINLMNKEKANPEFSAQDWLDINYKNTQRYFGNVPSIEAVISGKIEFMRMVEGEERLKKYSFYKKALELDLVGSKKGVNVEDDKNKQRQEEWIEKWQDYFDKRDQLLISKINFDEITDPREKFDKQLVVEFNVVDNLDYKMKKYDHNPHELAKKLFQFRSTNNPWGRLVHASNEKYLDVKLRANKELRKLYNNRKEQFPYEIYGALKYFIKKLFSDEYKEKYDKKKMNDIFGEISSDVDALNRAYRFEDSNDEQSLKDTLYYLLNESQINSNKYKYIEIPNEISNQFLVMSSTRNIYTAISNIFAICQKHSNGIGAFSVKLERKVNKTILKLVDIASYAKKRLENVQSGSGDFERLKALLWGYCDFNIYTIYNGKNYKVPMLPIVSSGGDPIDENIDGFTYELVFYNPIKILIIDDGIDEDGQPRLDNFNKLVENEYKYRVLTDGVEETSKSLEEFHYYNAVFIHSSYSRYEELKPRLIEAGMPILSFSGGKNNHFDTKKPNILTLGANDFYINLQNFLDLLIKDQRVNLSKIYSIVNEVRDNQDKITEESITRKIKEGRLDYPELSTDVYNNIKELTTLDEIPDFQSRRELSLFLEDF